MIFLRLPSISKELLSAWSKGFLAMLFLSTDLTVEQTWSQVSCKHDLGPCCSGTTGTHKNTSEISLPLSLLLLKDPGILLLDNSTINPNFHFSSLISKSVIPGQDPDISLRHSYQFQDIMVQIPQILRVPQAHFSQPPPLPLPWRWIAQNSYKSRDMMAGLFILRPGLIPYHCLSSMN